LSIPVYRHFEPTPPPAGPDEHEVLIVGGGPVGLSLALDLAQRGRKVTVLTKRTGITAGSKAICFAKRTLDIFDRLGIGKRVCGKGVRWSRGHVYLGGGEDPIYSFDLTDAPGQKNPAFVNIQQYYVEEYLVDALRNEPLATIRWGHQAVDVDPQAEGVEVTVEADGGAYSAWTRYLVACDGHRSPVRAMLGLSFDGRVFEDNFLIADVRFEREMPAERHFWFDPPWPGASALMHRQPDNIWRLDFQVGRDIDKAEAVKPENVDPFVRGMLGEDTPYEYEWLSIYTFQCRRMQNFVHGRVLFAGDAAHLVSPFGARGCNGGVADADNLGWKLDRVLTGESPPSLLQSYDDEAREAADVNIRNSTRATDFMTPKSEAQRAYRDAALDLAALNERARPYVNSGRLSAAVAYPDSPLNTPDRDDWKGEGIPPGYPPLDAAIGEGWLLGTLGGDFTLLGNLEDQFPDGVRSLPPSPDVCQRYALGEGGATLLRPDGYIAGRWKTPDRALVSEAFNRARGNHGA
jgi:3-(3-hydroxy-phenyl)propionate hydroxylase